MLHSASAVYYGGMVGTNTSRSLEASGDNAKEKTSWKKPT
jgi:hypothetical protein